MPGSFWNFVSCFGDGEKKPNFENTAMQKLPFAWI